MAVLWSQAMEPAPSAKFQIEPVRSPPDLEATTTLFTAYAASLGIDLTFQDFESEMEGMPGKYAPPHGELLLARDSKGEAVGCAGLRPMLSEGCCEMKRLYVSPHGRGLGVGKALIDRALQTASTLGYREMRLDTLPSMAGAISLYKQAGFVVIPAYYDTPLPDTIFFSCDLGSSEQASG